MQTLLDADTSAKDLEPIFDDVTVNLVLLDESEQYEVDEEGDWPAMVLQVACTSSWPEGVGQDAGQCETTFVQVAERTKWRGSQYKVICPECGASTVFGPIYRSDGL